LPAGWPGQEETLMVDASNPVNIPRSFMTDMPVATVNVGLALMNRRSSAIADFWRSCAEIREPTELVAVQLSYWNQLVEDYQEALKEGVSQIGSTPAEPAEPAAQPAPYPAAPPS
jgi:hypothetical protein